MKLLLNIFFLLLISVFATAQQELYFETWSNKQADSLMVELNRTSNDTMQMFICRCLGFHFQETNRDSSLYFHEHQLALARKLHLKLWEGDALDQAGWVLSYLKNYPLSLQYFIEGIKILENPICEKNIWMITLFSKDKNPRAARLKSLGFIYNDLSQLYRNTGNKTEELSALSQGLKIGNDINNSSVLALVTANLSQVYLALHQLDYALLFGQQSLEHINISGYKTYKGYVLNTLGNVYLKRNQYGLAMQYFDSAITTNTTENTIVELPDTYLSLAELYKSLGKMDSAIYYAKKAMADDIRFGGFERMNQAYNSLYYLYKASGNEDSAYIYLQLYKTLGDSLNKAEKDKIYAYQNIGFNEQLKIKEQENERIQREGKIRTYTLIAGILVFMLIAFILYRNNRTRRKTNEILKRQKGEIEVQKKNVEQTLTELKSTQAQLIQSEKMASLGELTAGIAHEIQNPLNFVNNFSDVNKDLLGEMKEEIEKGNLEEVKAIAKDVIDNEEKINHHGKRADAIVKGMLQHSQASSGIREPTDINSLADEYLRLAYQAYKSKGSKDLTEINPIAIGLITELDNSLPLIDVVPQDIGRVLLNLFNNAFWACADRSLGAVNEKQHNLNKLNAVDKIQNDKNQALGSPEFVSNSGVRGKEDGFQLMTNLAGSSDTQASSNLQGSSSYQPIVTLTTKNLSDKIEIRIYDNGSGIPPHIINKIFQPFFTTKPTGQGTGLGLSLSYDIIKAHGGTITVNSKENVGTEFIIHLSA